MIDKDLIEKVEKFMIPYRNEEKSLSDEAKRIKIWNGVSGMEILYDFFADAVVDYETADHDNDAYVNRSAEELLKAIEYVKTYRVVTDNKIVKELKECQEKRSELESQVKGLKNLNTQLAEDKIKIDNVIRDIFKGYSAIKDKFKNKLPAGFFDYDDDPPESEITHG